MPLLQVGKEAIGDDTDGRDDYLLCESLVVADYVAETFADDAGIQPTRPTDRATTRLFTELCGSKFSYFPVLRARGTDDEASQVKAFEDGLVAADAFLRHARGGGDGEGPFVLGSRFSLAECNAAPFVQRCCAVLPAFTGGEGGGSAVDPFRICDDLGLACLKEWMEAVLSRPSVVASGVPEEDMLRSTTRMLERFASVGTK